MKTHLTKEQAMLWVEALRSGNYKQERRVAARDSSNGWKYRTHWILWDLYKQNSNTFDSFCCLGLLRHCGASDGVDFMSSPYMDIVPGLNQDDFIYMNDKQKLSFEEISDRIEEAYS